MPRLKYTAFLQKKNSQWCGPACLALIFNLFGKKYSVSQIAKKLPISKEYGIGIFDLALFPLKEKYAVDIFA
jgi:ABC-type bacteriocin/lantibiotic exporter with double-glycine peptidase domain